MVGVSKHNVPSCACSAVWMSSSKPGDSKFVETATISILKQNLISEVLGRRMCRDWATRCR